MPSERSADPMANGDVRSWHIASFRCAAEFGRGIADSDNPSTRHIYGFTAWVRRPGRRPISSASTPTTVSWRGSGGRSSDRRERSAIAMVNVRDIESGKVGATRAIRSGLERREPAMLYAAQVQLEGDST